MHTGSMCRVRPRESFADAFGRGRLMVSIKPHEDKANTRLTIGWLFVQ